MADGHGVWCVGGRCSDEAEFEVGRDRRRGGHGEVQVRNGGGQSTSYAMCTLW